MSDEPFIPNKPSSPPCYADDLQFKKWDALNDISSADNVARWRITERVRLIKLRQSVPAAIRKQAAQQAALQLDSLIEQHGSIGAVSLYWPFLGELNLRDWMESAHDRGIRIALPEVIAKAQPLIFRVWTPDARMLPGIWNIPVPVDGAVVTPDVVIAPLVGYDPEGYRLGYGGGFFDRTLAAMASTQAAPLIVGVGHSCAAIASIYPQTYDLPMNVIVTETERIDIRLQQ